MKLDELFGTLVVAMLILYGAWVLMAQNSADRIIRACSPVYYVSKPFSSAAKLADTEISVSIAKFASNRETDCRFIVYDMFYTGDEAMGMGLKNEAPVPITDEPAVNTESVGESD